MLQHTPNPMLGREVLDEVSHVQPISMEKTNPLLDRPGDVSAHEQGATRTHSACDFEGSRRVVEQSAGLMLEKEKEKGATIAAVEEISLTSVCGHGAEYNLNLNVTPDKNGSLT